MESVRDLIITKVNGDQVPFEVAKLQASLERSGAGEALINDIVGEVEHELYHGISTKEIYKKAFSLLRKKSRSSAAKYRLKQAIIELGPTGFPFEKFIGELLKHQGYDVQVGVFVQGHCVKHEIDVVAEKSGKHLMIECKFHSDQKRKCDVKVPLYIQSRFLDVKKKWESEPQYENKFHQGWVVNNTRFTKDAMQYGNCAGLNLIGWDYPKQGSLKERIDTSGLHPITCLTSLVKNEKQRLLDNGIVLCKQLLQYPEALSNADIKPRKHKSILKEAAGTCES